ncbi:hypothetical protein U9M48_038016 [Paspalum notatum var. saurae]|uniref:Uncharacterized protein n=1 Tax=Paspalum notatum var. saurae TaxID=547442 RepID=A0AAQ3XAP1_PASNO
MDSLMKRIDESRAGVDWESGVLCYEPLPMEATLDDAQGMASAIGAIRTIVPGEVDITKVAMDTDIGAATTGMSSMLPRPPMASIFSKEPVPMTGLAAAASLAVGAVPTDINSDAPNNCLRKCLSPEVGVQTSKSAAEGMPTSSSSYVLPDICTLRLPVMRLKSPDHNVLGACQFLTEFWTLEL